ncbi:hypothetical protein Tdes44962_MAKER03012 [Teratosphaeria destructans]|uniref:Uncharacterized protein n=1 Tax=Teratosphaeria destructans TaxID=418781 RepID=A0A9W7SRG5_9PEZI|nr:hypothetical protein Tdes44962_MAKER03012 [Teratosphaeria destructans]
MTRQQDYQRRLDKSRAENDDLALVVRSQGDKNDRLNLLMRTQGVENDRLSLLLGDRDKEISAYKLLLSKLREGNEEEAIRVLAMMRSGYSMEQMSSSAENSVGVASSGIAPPDIDHPDHASISQGLADVSPEQQPSSNNSPRNVSTTGYVRSMTYSHADRSPF